MTEKKKITFKPFRDCGTLKMWKQISFIYFVKLGSREQNSQVLLLLPVC